jgi:alpha/beta superfamily hydrolase
MLKPLNRRRTRLGREARIFAGAVLVGLVHALDDAVLNRQPGVPADQHLVGLALVSVTGVAATVLFGRLRTGLRSALALVAGAFTLTNGGLHVVHVATAGAERSDYTGVLASISGLALVGLGVAIPWLHRGEGDAGRLRRWVNRGVAVVAAAVLAQFFVLPVGVGMVQTHMYRREVAPPPRPAFQPVTFDSTDGLRLSGWYVPSQNRAAVVVVNSAGGIRNGSMEHAELLAEHGYGVLLYDARGSGESEGSPNGWGWGWEHDVAGAVDFLRDQPDVDADRLGGLGLSTGADVLIEAAATRHDLRVVVADGATAMSFADRGPGVLAAAFSWPMITAGEVFSGTSQDQPLTELAAQVSPTALLLIATGSIPMELYANERYAAAAREPVELWKLPEVGHTNAIEEVADEYERRVIDHLDSVLLN